MDLTILISLNINFNLFFRILTMLNNTVILYVNIRLNMTLSICQNLVCNLPFNIYNFFTMLNYYFHKTPTTLNRLQTKPSVLTFLIFFNFFARKIIYLYTISNLQFGVVKRII